PLCPLDRLDLADHEFFGGEAVADTLLIQPRVQRTSQVEGPLRPYDAFRSASGYLMREWYSAISPLHRLSSIRCSSVSVSPLSSNWPSSSRFKSEVRATREVGRASRRTRCHRQSPPPRGDRPGA